MISDFVKGKKRYDYPANVQNGITLHRKIDEYTDHHPATQEAKQFLRSACGLYAGGFIDIVYDHFLANDPHEFEQAADLAAFAARTYEQLASREAVFPEQFGQLFFYMRSQNWLFGYRSPEGIRRSFQGLAHRAKYLADAGPACRAFTEHYEPLRNCYEYFFPSLKVFAYNELLYLRPEA
jgi:acyl carrier protein phosphodiesterase